MEKHRHTERDLPKLVRVDEDTHKRLKDLKRKQKKSMAQIIIDLVEREYSLFTQDHGEQQKQAEEENEKIS